MSRQVVTRKDVEKAAAARRAAAGPQPLASPEGMPPHGAPSPVAAPAAELPEVDGYTDRLVKYIPTEVVALYLTLAGVLATVPEEQKPWWIFWAIFVGLVLLTPVYLYKLAKVTKWQQLLISTAAFFVWVFALGGPFEETGWYYAWQGALLLPLFTVLVPLLEVDA